MKVVFLLRTDPPGVLVLVRDLAPGAGADATGSGPAGVSGPVAA